MKRILLLLILAAVCVFFCSCGSGGEQDGSTDSTENTEQTEPEEVPDNMNSGNFVSDKYTAELGGKLYYADDSGLWMYDPASGSELLIECSATNLATNGKVVYYGVFNKTVPYEYSGTTADIHQYDMYRYDLRTGTNEKITSFTEAGKPVCAVGDCIYYTDYPEDFDGNTAGVAHSLFSYNVETGEKTLIDEGAHLVDSYNGKIFYRDIMTAGTGFGKHQIRCYSTAKKTIKVISEDNVMSFKIISGKLYYNTKTDKYVDGKASTTIKICNFDILSGKTSVMLEQPGGNYQVKDYDDKYAIITEGSGSVPAYSILNFETRENKRIPQSDFENGIPAQAMRLKGKTYFYTDNDSSYVYTMYDGSTAVSCSEDSYTWRTMLTVMNDTVFSVDKDSKDFYFYDISGQKLS